jgi:D-alanyl-D-alanine carboxypeptidase
MKITVFFLVYIIVAGTLILITCKDPYPLNINNNNDRNQNKTQSIHILPLSKLLQAVLDLDTKLFRGQGVSASIIMTNNRYWAGTSGFSEAGKQVTAEMVFNIGSIGKNFLAALILQLSEEGKLILDDPISKWGLGSSSIDRNTTIRQLLNHTSGIFDWVEHPQSPYRQKYSQIEFERRWTQDEILTLLYGDLYFKNGCGWHYSTTNYNLLKIIAEKITGTSVSYEISRRFLQPLELKHTVALDIVNSIHTDLEFAHGWFDINGDRKPDDISGDSQNWIISMSPNMMYASALDLAEWSQALFEGKVLSEASLTQMLCFHHPTPGEPPITGYGLGTAEISFKGLLRTYGHLGFHYGNMSAMLYFPKFRSSLVVLTNGNDQLYQYMISFSLLMAIVLIKFRYFLYVAILIIVFFISCSIYSHINKLI